MRTIDVVSDAICPWCWIGKAHLDAALAELRQDGLEFRIRWRPFQLNPDMPEAGVERDAYRAGKFGSLERSRELDAQVAAAPCRIMRRTAPSVQSFVTPRWPGRTGSSSSRSPPIRCGR